MMRSKARVVLTELQSIILDPNTYWSVRTDVSRRFRVFYLAYGNVECNCRVYWNRAVWFEIILPFTTILVQRALFKVCDKHCFANHLLDWFIVLYKTTLLVLVMCCLASIFLSLLLVQEQRGGCLMSCVHWGLYYSKSDSAVNVESASSGSVSAILVFVFLVIVNVGAFMFMISSVVVKIRNKFHVIASAFDVFIVKTKQLFWSKERKNEAELGNIKFHNNPRTTSNVDIHNTPKSEPSLSTNSSVRPRLDSSNEMVYVFL